jgi:hypothetical protein
MAVVPRVMTGVRIMSADRAMIVAGAMIEIEQAFPSRQQYFCLVLA